MKVSTLCVVLGCLFVSLAGCKSDREEAAENTVDAWEEVIDEMKDIKSNKELVEAKPKLEKLGARLKDEMKKMQTLGEGDANESASLEKEFKPRMEKIMAEITTQAKRLEKDLGPTGAMDFFAALRMDPSDAPVK